MVPSCWVFLGNRFERRQGFFIYPKEYDMSFKQNVAKERPIDCLTLRNKIIHVKDVFTWWMRGIYTLC